jgi:hypothetical protein
MKTTGQIAVKKKKDESIQVSFDRATASEAFGTQNIPAIERLMMTLAQGVGFRDNTFPMAAVEAIRVMGPQNVIEGMLMAQMLMLHEQVARLMHLSRRADLPIDLGCRVVQTANSCTETFKEGMEALTRFRSGGKQQVIVSHINVEHGAQAAVSVGGDVRGGGGGTDAKR